MDPAQLINIHNINKVCLNKPSLLQSRLPLEFQNCFIHSLMISDDLLVCTAALLQVYWCNGAQITSPHDKEILRSIEEQLEPWSASCWDEEMVESSSLRTDPLNQINSCYMDELTSLCFHR